MFVFHINYKDPDKPNSITRCKEELVEWCQWFVTKLESLIWSSPMLTTNRQQKGHQWWIVIRYTPVNEHSNGKWILWRCISYYWEWGYSIAMLVYQRVNFEVLFISSYEIVFLWRETSGLRQFQWPTRPRIHNACAEKLVNSRDVVFWCNWGSFCPKMTGLIWLQPYYL